VDLRLGPGRCAGGSRRPERERSKQREENGSPHSRLYRSPRAGPLVFLPVKLDWQPEPTPEEREALERALARHEDSRPEPRSAWWREGVRESVSAEDEAD